MRHLMAVYYWPLSQPHSRYIPEAR